MGIWSDAKNILKKDPAAKSMAQVVFLYPGFHALIYHRVANWLFRHKRYFLARYVSQRGRFRTGIEIHPGATIGANLFIDHGAGVVIGETAEVGDNVTIYHGVTLGGTGKDVGKRHPTIEDGVLIGAGTKVLGPITIGKNSRIGAGSTVLCNIPPNSTAVGSPAVIARQNGVAVSAGRPAPSEELDQLNYPNLYEQRLSELEALIKKLSDEKAG